MLLKWKGFESSLLSVESSPCRAAVKQSANDTGVVYWHLCLRGQLEAFFSHISREVSEGYFCLSDALVDLFVHGKFVADVCNVCNAC